MKDHAVDEIQSFYNQGFACHCCTFTKLIWPRLRMCTHQSVARTCNADSQVTINQAHNMAFTCGHTYAPRQPKTLLSSLASCHAQLAAQNDIYGLETLAHHPPESNLVSLHIQ